MALLLIVGVPKIRKALTAGLIALPIVIGLTRIYFGVHFISDVIAGWSMGALVAVVCHCAYFYFYNKRKKVNAKA